MKGDRSGLSVGEYADHPEVTLETLGAQLHAVESELQIQKERSEELEAGIVRIATYLGVLHVLKQK